MPDGNLIAALRHLAGGQVEFIVVGGLAAELDGAPSPTLEFELVYSRDPANVDRILAVLDSLDAIFRMQPERRLRPARSHVAAGGHLNLVTRFGPLDLLGTIGRDSGFDELLPHSREMNIGHGIRIHVLNLETVISTKEQVASEKDLAVLPLLRRTLKEIRQKTKA